MSNGLKLTFEPNIKHLIRVRGLMLLSKRPLYMGLCLDYVALPSCLVLPDFDLRRICVKYVSSDCLSKAIQLPIIRYNLYH